MLGVPTGVVTITIDGFTALATIQSSGSFSVAFPTAKIPVGAFTITYAYAGSTNVAAGSATGRLTVTLAIKTQYNYSQPFKKGATITLTFETQDANGIDVGSLSRNATASAIANSATPRVLLALLAGSSGGGKFTPTSDHRTFSIQVATATLPPAQYILYFAISGDPVTHALTFIIAN